MHIKEFQRLMRDIYGANDDERGLQKTQLWFFEEVGELAEAMRKMDKKATEEEMADVFAWMVSLANMLGVDVEEACISKYNMKCPRCGNTPCKCDKE